MRVVGLALAVLMLIAGVLWTGEGLGWWGEGGRDAGVRAIAGPVLAGLGVALGYVVARSRPAK